MCYGDGTVREEKGYADFWPEADGIVRVALDGRLDSELGPVLALVFGVKIEEVFLGTNPRRSIHVRKVRAHPVCTLHLNGFRVACKNVVEANPSQRVRHVQTQKVLSKFPVLGVWIIPVYKGE